jgi:hypothetical protein
LSAQKLIVVSSEHLKNHDIQMAMFGGVKTSSLVRNPLNRIFIVVMLFLGPSLDSVAQPDESISVQGTLYNAIYKYQGRMLAHRQLLDVISPGHPDLASRIKAGKAMEIFGLVVSTTGGGLFGYPIGYYIASRPKQTTPFNTPQKEPFNWTILGIGAGAVALGVVIDAAGKSARKQSVEIYNYRLSEARAGIRKKREVQFTAGPTGIILSF